MSAFAWAVLLAGPAAAHASFEAASPAPGTGLPQAPATVAIRFSETLNFGLSGIDVTDARGQDVAVGRTEPVPRDAFAMRRRVGVLRPGTYTVRWLSVSRADGHSLRGSYHFAVGTAAGDRQTVRTGPLASGGFAGLLGRFVALLGLLLWIGAVSLGDAATRAGLGQRIQARIRRLAPLAAVIGLSGALLAEALGTRAGIGGVYRLLRAGTSGHWHAVEIGALLAGAALPTARRVLQWPLVGLAILGEVGSGHAAAAARPSVAAASFALHLVAVGVWVYAMVAAALAPDTRRVLRALSRHAIVAAVAVAATGTLNTALEIGAVGNLASTGYGRSILVKIGGLLVLGGLGLGHRLNLGAPLRRLRLAVRTEGSVAVAVVLVTAVLVGFANPPRDTDAAAPPPGVDPGVSSLGSRPALSLATASGPYVIGLTVTPPKPGPVELRAEVLGAEAGDGLGDATVTLSGPEGTATVGLRSCGFGCFAGRATLPNTPAVAATLAIASTRSQIRALFTILTETTDGRPALANVLAGQERLRSEAMTEQIRSSEPGPTVTTRYRFAAPDAFQMDAYGAAEIVIGGRSFNRQGSSGPWDAQPWPGQPYTWPARYFRDFWRNAAAVRVLGTESLDGTSMTVIAFVRTDLPAWFRLWVDSDGIVRREQMWAEGHLMVHSYSDVNSAVTITPP